MAEIPILESIVLPQFHRPVRTVQIQYRLKTTSNHVDMGRPMVIRINYNA